MLEVLRVIIRPGPRRIACVHVKYHDIILMCDLCIYKNEKLWIRMPEHWATPTLKVSSAHWEDKAISDTFQMMVLDMIKKQMGFDLKAAIKIKQEWLSKKKKADKNK